ncbi:MAG TPA: ABC transporter substrate-binding protein [Pseudonocardiaceae bacterium]|nr:ABC transporter substrate-binding protein [Pseudonocardiaceae bacterium]
MAVRTRLSNSLSRLGIGKGKIAAAGLCVATVTAALALAGCGATTSAPGGSASSGGNCTPGQATQGASPSPMSLTLQPDAASAAQVPANYKSKGTLTIAADASYAPNEFTAGNGAIIGMDVDLGNAIAQTLGMKANFVNASFDGILAGIQAGRYDLGMSSFSVTAAREQQVDFVSYFTAGTSTMVTKCNPANIKTLSDLCGKSVGAENGTTQLDQLTKPDVDGSIVKTCQQAGKSVPKAQGFPDQTGVNSALQAGRIDAYLADSPVVDYALKQTGDAFTKVGGNLDTAPYGIAMPKTEGTLKNAIQAAVQHLIDDGTYAQILQHWGVSSGAVKTAAINPSAS